MRDVFEGPPEPPLGCRLFVVLAVVAMSVPLVVLLLVAASLHAR